MYIERRPKRHINNKCKLLKEKKHLNGYISTITTYAAPLNANTSNQHKTNDINKNVFFCFISFINNNLHLINAIIKLLFSLLNLFNFFWYNTSFVFNMILSFCRIGQLRLSNRMMKTNEAAFFTVDALNGLLIRPIIMSCAASLNLKLSLGSRLLCWSACVSEYFFFLQRSLFYEIFSHLILWLACYYHISWSLS